MTKLEELPIEEISYLDHSKWADIRAWDHADKLTLCPSVVKTYGIVVEDVDSYITVAATIAPVANKVSGLQCIVRGAIISRRVILEPQESEK